MTLKLILTTLLLTFSFASGAINMSFRKYQVNDGLSENSVQCILQDHLGYMWIGTKDGLNKFNGYEYTIFKNNPSDPGSIGNNFIRALYEDSSKQIWVGTDQYVYIFDPKTESFRLFNVPTDNGVLINSAITSITAEDDHTIWIGTMSQGAFRFNNDTGELHQYLQDKGKYTLNSNLIWKIYKDASNTIWIGTRNGLSRYFKETNSFLTFGSREEKQDLNDPEILSIFEDSDGDLWLGTWSGGLVQLNPSTNHFNHYFNNKNQVYISHIRSIFEYRKNELLVGSDDGLYLFNKKTKQIERLDDQRDPNSLSDQNVYSIYKDRENGIWIGTYFGGLNYLSPTSSNVEHYYPNYKKTSMSGKAVSQFCEDVNGDIWIATEDGGLNLFNPKTGSFKSYLSNEKGNIPSYHNLHALTFNNKQLWIGTFSRGLDVLDIETQTFKNYQYNINDTATIDDNCVFSLLKTKNGELYVGTPFGLSRYNPVHNNFFRIPEVRNFVYDITEDYKGNIWVATYGNGIYRFDRQSKTWNQYIHNPKDDKSLCHNKIIDIYEDSKHRLWFGSEGGGLCKFNYDTQDFSTIDQSNGLPNDVVYGILDDKYGNIWISTNKGITRINPENMMIKTLTQEDGLQSNQFNYRSSFKASDGKMYFGGINGFNAFYPNLISDNAYIPPVHITNFELLEVDEPLINDTVLNRSINFDKKIVLSYNQASFRISFVSLSFQAHEKNMYSYYMENLNSRWATPSQQRQVSYINLAPGEYTFKVKGSNNNGIWNQNEDYLHIIILPPWWKTKLAFTFYFITIALVTFSIFRYYLNIVRLRQRIKLEEFQSEKEKEVYTSKINFFTNIAHEIRTPVSLIRAPLDSILASRDGNTETRENLAVINKNTERLINLVNQLLDFRKIEKEGYAINLSSINLNELINETCYRFKPAAKKNNIRLNIDLPQNNIFINADKDALIKVLSNLITNALKFTKSYIEIKLDNTNNQRVCISVNDNGPGIEDQYHQKIFEPFFQIEKDVIDDKKYGTGIGLALSKQLIDKHHGELTIANRPHGGCSFTIKLDASLLITENLTIPNNNGDEYQKHEPKAQRQHNHFLNRPTILLVEDNEDLIRFLDDNLKKEYNILTALNGKLALDILEAETIDLMVSDIVMPEVGGLELVKRVREHNQFSHIPIIILSARTNLDSKIDGLDYGAESYIEKPFSTDYLKAQINSLLSNRLRIIEKFSQSPFIPYGSIATTKKDEEFLERLNNAIEQHINDPELNIEHIASLLSMSRSNLQRKIKGLSEMTPNDYVRVYRLKKAAKLISAGEYRINEVCYLVGFNSPSYFSKCFKKQFGHLPKDFIKNNTSA